MRTVDEMTELEKKEFMELVTNSIDQVINASDLEPPHFILMMFNDPEYTMALSNCAGHKDVVKMLNLTAQRFQNQNYKPII